MKTMRIFIVEDDLVSAEYLKTILEKENSEIIGIADNGNDAIDALKTCGADLVLMDIILKGKLTGIETALTLKRMHPECKVIFLTAYADQEMVDSAVNVRASAYLMKPYREKEIIATIRMALHQEHNTEKNMPTAKSYIPLQHGYGFDLRHDRLVQDGSIVPLSQTMLKMIRLLSSNHDNVIPTETLSTYIWNEQKSNSTLRSLINRFRKTVDEEIIINVNGVGYLLKSDTA